MATVRLKNRYIETLGVLVMVLALIRCVFPGIAGQDTADAADDADTLAVQAVGKPSEQAVGKPSVQAVGEHPVQACVEVPDSYIVPAYRKTAPTRYVAEGARFHRIVSVPQYTTAFPDSNHVQLLAARHWGVSPVKNRADAEKRMNELVYVGESPYYDVAKLDASIPYLVPRAAILLQDIGAGFFDSLQVKGVPMCRLVVSSLLRTEEDVARLRLSNKNATEQSCHLYGTTFDINYNTFAVVCDPDGPSRENIQETRLKQILSEVLNDLRQQERCYVKYEYRQPCFHITVR